MPINAQDPDDKKRFKVALSFAGENRDYVEKVAKLLAQVLGREAVFYDNWYKFELARPQLNRYLGDIYHRHSQLIVPFLCEEYTTKNWCNLEWRVLEQLIFSGNVEAIMPLRFEMSEQPSFYGIDGFIDISKDSEFETAVNILRRIALQEGLDQEYYAQQLQPTATKASVTQNQTPVGIYLNKLPTTEGKFFGRQHELSLLDEAYQEKQVRLMEFVAPGGTGKTKLIQEWLDNTQLPQVCMVWSFYSQGAGEDKQSSAEPFFTEAFRQFELENQVFNSEIEKGQVLAKLFAQRDYLLILDGLEPLQFGSDGMLGGIKDQALQQFFSCLLRMTLDGNYGMCLVTTRISMSYFKDKAYTQSEPLDNLSIADGVKLLESLGIKGNHTELAYAVEEYGRHALALRLLGNILKVAKESDINRRNEIREFTGEMANNTYRHAKKVMQAYADWFAGTTEEKLLSLLGLFDHPIEESVLLHLLQQQIPGLTQGVTQNQWQQAIYNLKQEHQLLTEHGYTAKSGEDERDLDCHPLIREFFGLQLKQNNPDAWQQAHLALYKLYLEQQPKELPDTLEEMRPLFHALVHGCAAGRVQEAFDEIYWERILRKEKSYLSTRLGQDAEELAVLACFFKKHWVEPSRELVSSDQNLCFNIAGVRLIRLGRYKEARLCLLKGIKLSEDSNDWEGVLADQRNVSVADMFQGELKQASYHTAKSLEFIHKRNLSPKSFILSGALFARLQYLYGNFEVAKENFDNAEERLQNDLNLQFLIGDNSFWHISFFLSTQDFESADLKERAEYSLQISQEHRLLRDIGLGNLSMAKIARMDDEIEKTATYLEQAITNLYKAGQVHYIQIGLIERANFHIQQNNLDLALADLQQVEDVVFPNGMRLFQTDYHLAMARLGLARCDDLDTVKQHITKAAGLIESTSYHLRDDELKELQLKVA